MKTFLLIRIIHVLAGAFWTGAAVTTAWFLIPAALDSGPDGAKVMAALERRGFMTVLPSVAGLGVLSGLYLYWRYTAGFSAEVSRTHAAMAYGTGGAIAIVALILGGSFVSRGFRKAGELSQRAMATPDGPARGALLADATKLRLRALLFARIVSVMLVVTIALMSIAVFL